MEKKTDWEYILDTIFIIILFAMAIFQQNIVGSIFTLGLIIRSEFRYNRRIKMK